MYENVFPEVDSIVMVQVTSIAEMGAYVQLLEYNNIEGTTKTNPTLHIPSIPTRTRPSLGALTKEDKIHNKNYQSGPQRTSPRPQSRQRERFIHSHDPSSSMKHQS